MSNVTLSRDLHVSEKRQSKLIKYQKITLHLFVLFDLQSMAELLAENYHNIWAKKKKLELEAKGMMFPDEISNLISMPKFSPKFDTDFS